jgi:predicted TIM-barrel fold metal-dependent hydrolase
LLLRPEIRAIFLERLQSLASISTGSTKRIDASFCSTRRLPLRPRNHRQGDHQSESGFAESRHLGGGSLSGADSCKRVDQFGESLMTISLRMDVSSLTAIDVHVHLEAVDDATATDNAAKQYFGDSGASRDPQALAEYYHSRRIAFVICAVDENLTGRPRVTNDEVIRFASKNSDIAIPSASIDPHRGPEGVREARRLVSEGDARGLKLHPPVQQFFPNDPIAYPLYEVFAPARLPVIFHTGHSGIGTGMPGGGGVRLKYGNPLPIDDVAVDFPTLPIIMAHPSFSWQDEAISICLHKPMSISISRVGLRSISRPR